MEAEKYEKTIYELKQLLEVTKVLNSTLNFKKLVDSILFTFMAQARCVKAALYIGKELDPEIIVLQRNYMGFDIGPTVPIQMQCKSKTLLNLSKEDRCLSIKELKPLLINEPIELIELIEEQVELIIPLNINKKLAGIIILGGRIDSDAIEKSEKDFLSQIGLYSSIAMQNAILFDMATMDMMTELKVRHYLTKFMDECIEQGDHQFVILMLDIDDFKQVNDKYGHQAGDNTLIAVANILKNAIRTNDIAARYGGEEFVIMLRETNLESSMIVAERIRKEIEELKIRAGEKIIQTTISIGVAEFDSDLDKTPGDVISRADSSLYISKNNGKNQITTA